MVEQGGKWGRGTGITRERMEGFDRKITEEPQYFGDDKKDALIGDFQNYLGIIKAVHEGADLQVTVSHTLVSLRLQHLLVNFDRKIYVLCRCLHSMLQAALYRCLNNCWRYVPVSVRFASGVATTKSPVACQSLQT